MELDETSPYSNFSSTFSVNRDIHSIASGVQSMTLDNDTDMLDSSGINEAPENPCMSTTKKQPLHSSTEAFMQLEIERKDTTFSRSCLFCRKHFTGNRSVLLEHFTEQHNFFIGQPDNLVYIDDFLDMLEDMLNKLQCLYCRKIFKDWSTLKEHMRKKMHKRINSADSNFDRFYMSNYLNAYDNMVPAACCGIEDPYSNQCSDTFIQDDEKEMSIMKQEVAACYDTFIQDDEKEINMEATDIYMICLYCDSKYFDIDEIMQHLKNVHSFDLRRLRKEYKLSFYCQVKLINYIRRKVLIKECTICDTRCATKETLVKHMTDSGHIRLLPDREKWDQSEFYFSTLDIDYLLCGLQDYNDDEKWDILDASVKIISEDIILPQSSILTDEDLRKTLL